MTQQPQGPQSGVAGAFSQLTDETAALVRREIDAAQTETLDKLKRSAPAAGLIAVAGVLAVLALASGHRWFLQLLEKRLPPASAALFAAVGYGAAGGLAASVGAQWLRDAPKPVPTDTARQVGRMVGDVAADARADDGTP